MSALTLLLAAIVAPWTQPLSFRPAPGWAVGQSGTTRSAYVGTAESTAWTARGVRYVDPATADPPNRTLAHLSANSIVVWAVIYGPAPGDPPIRLLLSRARHLPCCDGVAVAGGSDELAGDGPRHAYATIVRVFYGSRPTARLRAQAQRALDRMRMPAAR